MVHQGNSEAGAVEEITRWFHSAWPCDNVLMPMPVGLKVALVAIPTLTVVTVVPEFRLAGVAVLRRADQCSFTQTLNSFRTLKDRVNRIADIQASARLLQSDNNYDLWNTRDGNFWIPKRNRDTLFLNLAEEEQDIYGKGATGVHAGDTVLDCGANIGVYTRKALNDGARRVIAIEPAPENVECLRRNFAAEIQAGQVVVQAVGVWDQNGELPLRIDADTSTRNGFVGAAGPSTGTVVVPLVTIDAMADDLKLERVDFIKMDIEGAEKKAIAGAARTMARFHPRLAVAMEHLADDPTAIPAAINSFGLGYSTLCGPCLDTKSGVVRPDVLYFVRQ